MQRTLRVVVLTSVVAMIALGALGGCAAKIPGGSSNSKTKPNPGSLSHPTATVKPKNPTPKPAPTGPTPLPANALFRIYATVTAGNGATADLMQIVYKPIAADAADTALLNQQCNYPGQPDFQGQPTWQSQVPNALLLTTDMTATLRPGSPAFDNSADFVVFGFPGAPGAYSGQYGIFEAYCDSGYIQIPGSVHGVAPLTPADPVHGHYGWAASSGGDYGFSGGGNVPDGPDLGGTAVVKNCSIQMSAAALAAGPKEAAWPTQPYVTELGCSYIP